MNLDVRKKGHLEGGIGLLEGGIAFVTNFSMHLYLNGGEEITAYVLFYRNLAFGTKHLSAKVVVQFFMREDRPCGDSRQKISRKPIISFPMKLKVYKLCRNLIDDNA